MDTIFALASAPGKAGVSVIRISGADALHVASRLGARLAPHDRRLVTLKDAQGDLIDQAFALSFEEGHSFTGEPVVELQTHGSPAIVRAVQSELLTLGVRPAEPGEFTRRAMENGMLDLAQVEGLADLIDAETESQRRQAVRVFKGELGSLVADWRAKLLRAAALLEATIDFVDEDVPVEVMPEVQELLRSVADQVQHQADGVKVRERIRDGFEVALIGAPNAGKSTLLNRLAGRDAAITSDIAGTTRDVIEVRMDLGGFPVTFLDTAGVRASKDMLEGLGIERGQARAKDADVRVQLLAPDEAAIDYVNSGLDIHLLSKSDLRTSADLDGISGVTGEGVDALIERIVQHLSNQTQNAGLALRARHEAALRKAGGYLNDALSGLENESLPVDITAEDLRSAIRALDVVVGRIDVENVLGKIFSSFCIGK